MKVKNMVITSALSILTLLVWLPIWMLLTGSLMGEDEVYRNIGPILDQAKGMADWSLLPQYPTLRPYVEL
ncbi:MAG: ABC-type sugar transport system, permease component, partial [Herbinix sp.]|nr:ABC-type sugar transport system, permease component [Herbinix sp.]